MPVAGERLRRRLLSRRAGGQLVRNTIVSTFIFAVDLALLWLLVEQGGMEKVLAAAVAFIIANSLHYGFGRWWIFRGTERKPVEGYVYFLANAGVGMVITLALFAAFCRRPSGLLSDRASAGIVDARTAVFVLNAVLNFRTV